MFRKSICLSALLALGMVGSSFAQNLTDAAQAQVGTNLRMQLEQPRQSHRS